MAHRHDLYVSGYGRFLRPSSSTAIPATMTAVPMDWAVLAGWLRTALRLPAESSDQSEPADNIDPTEPAEPTLSTEPAEPTEPTDSTDPTEPTESTDPSLAMDSNESRDAMDQRDAIPARYPSATTRTARRSTLQRSGRER